MPCKYDLRSNGIKLEISNRNFSEIKPIFGISPLLNKLFVKQKSEKKVENI